jgi:hypothetical protein
MREKAGAGEMTERTPLLEAAGFWLGNLHEKATIKAGSTHELLPLSKAACVGGWRFTEKWFSGREFVAAGPRAYRLPKPQYNSSQQCFKPSLGNLWLTTIVSEPRDAEASI